MCYLCAMRAMQAGAPSAVVAAALVHGDALVKSSAFVSGSETVNALLEGFSWSGTSGTAATVNYSFGLSTMSASLFGSAETAAAKLVLQQYADVANLTFVGNANTSPGLTFSNTSLGTDVSGLTTSQFSASHLNHSEVQIDSSVNGFSVGSYGYLVLLHEIGHALGLKHPGNYNGSESGPFLPAADDSYNATVMSYNAGTLANVSNHPVSPMIYDIAAVQYLYGANHSYHAGDDVYTFNTAKTAQAIWDGGGNDTYDASAQTMGVKLDIREGLYNVTTVGSGDYWTAFGANIENANGGSGSDNIFGNALNNSLMGNAGNDLIRGGKGDDILQGNQGADTVAGDIGNDLVRGGKDNDSVYGGQGNDTVAGDLGDDRVSGDVGNDTIYGGQGNDLLFGLSDNDWISGDKGNDVMDGGTGSDVFFFGAGSGVDTIVGFEGAGAAAGDLIQVLINANGTGLTTVASLLSHITYDVGGAHIDLGAGNAIIVSGVATNAMTADDFQMV